MDSGGSNDVPKDSRITFTGIVNPKKDHRGVQVISVGFLSTYPTGGIGVSRGIHFDEITGFHLSTSMLEYHIDRVFYTHEIISRLTGWRLKVLPS